MARVAGVNIPDKKHLVISLTYIYGIGKKTSEAVCSKLNLNPDKKVLDLTEDELESIRNEIKNTCITEGDLRREVSMNIKRLIDLGCYRGIRHRRRLPVRGQRTNVNAKTARKVRGF